MGSQGYERAHRLGRVLWEFTGLRYVRHVGEKRRRETNALRPLGRVILHEQIRRELAQARLLMVDGVVSKADLRQGSELSITV